MLGRKINLSWLGAEALPGDLAEINRVHQAWLNAAAQHQRYTKELRQRGFGATAINWMKKRPPPSRQ
jgi:hypothetical protein